MSPSCLILTVHSCHEGALQVLPLQATRAVPPLPAEADAGFPSWASRGYNPLQGTVIHFWCPDEHLGGSESQFRVLLTIFQSIVCCFRNLSDLLTPVSYAICASLSSLGRQAFTAQCVCTMSSRLPVFQVTRLTLSSWLLTFPDRHGQLQDEVNPQLPSTHPKSLWKHSSCVFRVLPGFGAVQSLVTWQGRGQRLIMQLSFSPMLLIVGLISQPLFSQTVEANYLVWSSHGAGGSDFLCHKNRQESLGAWTLTSAFPSGSTWSASLSSFCCGDHYSSCCRTWLSSKEQQLRMEEGCCIYCAQLRPFLSFFFCQKKSSANAPFFMFSSKVSVFWAWLTW